jgi:hypothetical protein
VSPGCSSSGSWPRACGSCGRRPSAGSAGIPARRRSPGSRRRDVLGVRRPPRVHPGLVVAVALVGAHLGDRPVHRDLREIRTPEPDQLGAQVGEVAHLEQRVIGEVDAGNDVGGVECHLFGLGEEVVRIAVEHHLADRPDRNLLLRNDLCGVQQHACWWGTPEADPVLRCDAPRAPLVLVRVRPQAATGPTPSKSRPLSNWTIAVGAARARRGGGLGRAVRP